MVFDMLTIACRNTLNWRKCDVWWPLVTSILAWEKYDPNCFERTLYELSNIFFVFRYNVWSPRSRTIPSLLEPARNRINPRRHRPFHILLRHKGGGSGTTPLAVSPLIELELREKKERVARRETKRLIYKLKVLGQPVTSMHLRCIDNPRLAKLDISP